MAPQFEFSTVCQGKLPTNGALPFGPVRPAHADKANRARFSASHLPTFSSSLLIPTTIETILRPSPSPSFPKPPVSSRLVAMPPKRKHTEVDSAPTASAVPPSLPPSVEEAYRRKCIQLKNRTNEVEEANDAARLRLARIKRQVEKLRIERAFLLEQLAKRTSTNVEDSEGSPSPPPTEHFSAGIHEADANVRKPKDKPLRIKRGHRKTDADGKDTPSASFTQRAGSGSPAPSEQGDAGKKGTTNGAKKSAKPGDAFELFCSEERAAVEEQSKDKEDANVDEELERRWKGLSDEKKDEYKTQFEELEERREKEDKEGKEDKEDEEKEKDDAAPELKKEDEPAPSKPAAQDEDVEMGNSENAEQAEEKKDKEDKEAKESKD